MAFTYSVLPTAETFIAFHSLFYTAFPIPGIRKDVCAALRPAFQGTEGRTGATAACLVPLHAGASTDVETTRYSALWGILLVVALMRSAFYPYHSIPGRLRHGQTVTHSALCRPSYLRMPQGGKSPLLFVPPGRCPLYIIHPNRFYSGNAANPFLPILRAFLFSPSLPPPSWFYQMRKYAVALDPSA